MKTIYILILLFILQTITFSQPIKEPQSFWKIYPPSQWSYKRDSVDFFKSVITNPLSQSYDYDCAATYLVMKKDNSLRQFLLENMNHYHPTFSNIWDLLPPIEKITNWDSVNVLENSWDKFFIDQKIKGFLGIESAIAGMDSVARFTPNEMNKLLAVRMLSEIGKLDYFDFVKSYYFGGLDEYTYSFIYNYGKDSRYRDEVKTILSDAILDSTNAFKISCAASALSQIDKSLAIRLVDSKFGTTTGWTRYKSYFLVLGWLDPQGQADRSIYVIQNEPEDSEVESYIPDYNQSPSYNKDPKYYSPYFIYIYSQFYKNNVNPDFKGSYNFNDFKPIPFNPSTKVIDNISYLNGIIDTVSSYYWLADNTFSNELKAKLIRAKTELQERKDSLECRVQVKEFQDMVDNVYKDSQNLFGYFVTIEGWKFLYWNAQYILDRLPTLTPKASVKVFLEGPYANGQMMTTLNTAGFIPLAQPYNKAPWNYAGTESVSSIPPEIVDWVLIELRSTPTTRIYRCAAFLKNDGSLVKLDGVKPIEFPNIAAGDYYIVIQHRNHLAVMTSNKITLSLNPELYDMTTDVSKTYTIPNYPSPLKYMNDGKYVVYDGDCNSSGIISTADRNVVTIQKGLTGYFQGDVDLSGIVKNIDFNCVVANNMKFSYVPTITNNNPLNKSIDYGGSEISPIVDSTKALGVAYIENVQIKNNILSWDIYIKRTQNWSTETSSNFLGISSLCFRINSEELLNPKIIFYNQDLLNSSNYTNSTVQAFRNNCMVDLSLKSSDTTKELELNIKTKVLTIQVQISGDEQNVGTSWDKLNTGFSNNKDDNIPLQLEDFSKNKLQEQN